MLRSGERGPRPVKVTAGRPEPRPPPEVPGWSVLGGSRPRAEWAWRHSQQLGNLAGASSRENGRSRADGAILPYRVRPSWACALCRAGTAFSLRAHRRQVARSAAPPGSRSGTHRWARVLAWGQSFLEPGINGLSGKQPMERGLGRGKQFVWSQSARRTFHWWATKLKMEVFC